jgi:NTP pyrophosphatase (non-canonical NTP hydrolase)
VEGAGDTLVLLEVLAERGEQMRKWGVQSHTDNAWMTILVAEVGEAAQDVLAHDEENLRANLVQVAAVACAWVENIDRRRQTD